IEPRRSCPSDADLAALLDGALDAEGRARVLAHLADCEDCREVVAGAAAVRAAVAHEETPGSRAAAPGATIVPFARRNPAAPRPRVALGIAAAALLAVGALFLLPSRRGDGGFPTAGEVARALGESGPLASLAPALEL